MLLRNNELTRGLYEFSSCTNPLFHHLGNGIPDSRRHQTRLAMRGLLVPIIAAHSSDVYLFIYSDAKLSAPSFDSLYLPEFALVVADSILSCSLSALVPSQLGVRRSQ
jgi:hypothetical protein